MREDTAKNLLLQLNPELVVPRLSFSKNKKNIFSPRDSRFLLVSTGKEDFFITNVRDYMNFVGWEKAKKHPAIKKYLYAFMLIFEDIKEKIQLEMLEDL